MPADLDARILHLLSSENDPPLNVDTMATKLGISSPFASQRLKRLEKEGLVKRNVRASPTGRNVEYELLPWAQLRWSSPREGIVHGWRADGEIDWEFPLVSQLPDHDARSTILEFLHMLREEGLLHSRRGRKLAPLKKPVGEFNGATVIVYGSTARGSARLGADVDVFLLCKATKPDYVQKVSDLAAAVSLTAPRAIQLIMFGWDGDWERISPSIRAGLERDGLIIYDGLRERPGGSPCGFWSRVYGGRTGA